MSEENKAVELIDKELEKVAGGADNGMPKYQPGYAYVAFSGLISCLVEVKEFKEQIDDIIYYIVEYRLTYIDKVGPDRRGDLKRTILTEEQITKKVFINW